MLRKKVVGVKRGRTVARNVAANKIPSGGKPHCRALNSAGKRERLDTRRTRLLQCPSEFRWQYIDSPSNPVIINENEVPRPDLYRNRHLRRRRPVVAVNQEQGQSDAAHPARTSDRQIARRLLEMPPPRNTGPDGASAQTPQ